MRGMWGFAQERAVAEMADIAADVRTILVYHLGVEPAQLVDGARLAEDLGADSLDLVEIVMSFEEQFGIETPNHDATGLATVGDAVHFIEAQLAAARTRAATPSDRWRLSLR